MNDPVSRPARPVSLFMVVFLLAVFAAFFFLVRHFYHPAETAAFVAPPENLPKELAWKESRDSRRATLNDLRKEQAEQASTYGWVDQKAGVVRLPIERAMELTAQQYGAKK